MKTKRIFKIFGRNSKFIQRINNLIINLSNIYLNFLQNRMILKKNYISSIKDTFSDKLEEINYQILTPKSQIDFNKSDNDFLKALSNSYLEKHPNILVRWTSCAQPKNIPKLKIQREVFTCNFKDIKFFGSSGGLVQKNLALVESAFNNFRFKNCLMVDSKLLRHKEMKGIYTSIMHYFSSYSHYHWLIDNLPRLYSVLKLNKPEINFIIPKRYDKLHLEILKKFLDDRFKFIKIGYFDVWKLEEFYFPFFGSSDCSGYMPKKYLDFVKDRMIDAYNINTEEKGNRLYLSRDKDRWRHLLNEKQVIEILKKYNFIVVHPKDLSIKDQIELFNSAEIIVAPHGSALSNLIFAENCKVLELFAPYEFKSHFFMLSKALGFKYQYLKGSKQYNNNDFKVDLNEFGEKIKDTIKN